MTDSTPDSILVENLIQNQPAAYKQAYDYYGPFLLAYIARIVKDQTEAEDLLQDTFIKIWQNISHYDSSHGKLVTWMMKIARNTALDYLRSNSSHALIIDFNADTPQLAKAPNYTHIDFKELIYNSLTPKYRQVIELVYIEGYSMQEVADLLSLPLGTIKTQARFGIQILKKLFQ